MDHPSPARSIECDWLTRRDVNHPQVQAQKHKLEAESHKLSLQHQKELSEALERLAVVKADRCVLLLL